MTKQGANIQDRNNVFVLAGYGEIKQYSIKFCIRFLIDKVINYLRKSLYNESLQMLYHQERLIALYRQLEAQNYHSGHFVGLLKNIK